MDTVSATSGDDDTGDGRTDDGDQVEQRHEDTEQQWVGTWKSSQPEERCHPGDDRDQHIAQKLGADLGEHLVADEDRAGSAGVWH